jgi:hypothetical protein
MFDSHNVTTPYHMAANKIEPNITGVARIYSDCLGALNQVKNLPTDRIPSKCKHSDILKTIMIQCRVLSFRLKYSRVEAHQDNHQDFSTLSRPSQLNCACDLIANSKTVHRRLRSPESPTSTKTTSCSMCLGRTGKDDHRLSRQTKILGTSSQSKEGVFRGRHKVDWEVVHLALHSVPRMFQVFACKQVFDNGGTNRWLAKFDKSGKKSNKCPSCLGGGNSRSYHSLLSCRESRNNAGYYKRTGQMDEEG